MDRLEELRKFGLSAAAARTYVALLDYGETDAREVARAAEVPIPKVYSLLDKLQQRGLVEAISSSPKRYAPVPFADFLKRLQDVHAEQIRELKRKEQELQALFRTRGDLRMDDRGSFVSLRGRRSGLEKMKTVAQRATENLLLLAATGEAMRIATLRPLLATARARGTRVRLLVRAVATAPEVFAPLADVAEVRCSEDAGEEGRHVSLLIADRGCALILHYVPDDASTLQGHDVGVVTNYHSIVGALRDMLEAQWDRSVPLNVRRRDLSDGRSPVTARLYTSRRQGCEATLRAIRPGLQEYLRATTGVASPFQPQAIQYLRQLEETGASARHLINVQDAQTAESYLALSRLYRHQEFRHHDATYLRFVIADAQAFISVHRPSSLAHGHDKEDEERDLLLHTADPETVAPLRADFERIWQNAERLADRKERLTSVLA